MSHRIELKNNVVIVQLATPKGIVFRLIQEHIGGQGELLDEATTAQEILLSAERFQESKV